MGKVANVGKIKSRSKRAGLEFPVGRVNRFMKNRHLLRRTSGVAAIAMTAALQLVVIDILDAAIKCAERKKKTRISSQHIRAGVYADADLRHFFSRALIMGGGVTATPKLSKPKSKAAVAEALADAETAAAEM